MASNRAFAAIAVAAVFVLLPAFALGVEYKVGDDKGWNNNFNYTAWASDKEFHVGDKLVFIYPQGKHNVYKVNGTDFKNCTVPPANGPLTTGHDVVPLATEGKKWYICGVAGHCAAGQKLVITVLPAQAPSPSPWAPSAPTPGSPNSAYGNVATGYLKTFVAAAVAAVMVALV